MSDEDRNDAGVSDEDRNDAELRSAAARLDEISTLLAGDELEDAAAVELAREAAQIAADVGAIAADAARAASESGEAL